MKTRKTFIIIEVNTGRILHTTSDKFESMKRFAELQKNSRSEVVAQCIYR